MDFRFTIRFQIYFKIRFNLRFKIKFKIRSKLANFSDTSFRRSRFHSWIKGFTVLFVCIMLLAVCRYQLALYHFLIEIVQIQYCSQERFRKLKLLSFPFTSAKNSTRQKISHCLHALCSKNHWRKNFQRAFWPIPKTTSSINFKKKVFWIPK